MRGQTVPKLRVAIGSTGSDSLARAGISAGSAPSGSNRDQTPGKICPAQRAERGECLLSGCYAQGLPRSSVGSFPSVIGPCRGLAQFSSRHQVDWVPVNTADSSHAQLARMHFHRALEMLEEVGQEPSRISVETAGEAHVAYYTGMYFRRLIQDPALLKALVELEDQVRCAFESSRRRDLRKSRGA